MHRVLKILKMRCYMLSLVSLLLATTNPKPYDNKKLPEATLSTGTFKATPEAEAALIKSNLTQLIKDGKTNAEIKLFNSHPSVTDDLINSLR